MNEFQSVKITLQKILRNRRMFAVNHTIYVIQIEFTSTLNVVTNQRKKVKKFFLVAFLLIF